MIIAALLLLPLLPACGGGSSATRYYVLDSMPADKAVQSVQAHSIAIMQIEIPPYLDRPKLVARDAGNQLRIAGYEQWGGHLRDNIARTLADNLSSRLSASRVDVAPFPGSLDADVAVLMDVRSFERMPDGYVHMQVQWHVKYRHEADQGISRMEHFKSASRVGAEDYAGMVRAMSVLLGELSDHLANAITGLDG